MDGTSGDDLSTHSYHQTFAVLSGVPDNVIEPKIIMGNKNKIVNLEIDS